MSQQQQLYQPETNPEKQNLIDLDMINTAPPPYQPSTTCFGETSPSAPAPDERTAKVRALCERYQINPHFEPALWSLNEYHIIFICDDSGSMNTTAGVSGYDRKTRWDELKGVIREVYDISLIFDPLGMDIHFLNRQSWLNVRNLDAINDMFVAPPSGGTPLVSKLTEITRTYSSQPGAVGSANRKLVIIATDGEPSDDSAPYRQLKAVLGQMVSNNMRIGFIACTDQDYQVEYLNDIDREYKEIDVSDDYWTERKQILKVQGLRFPFSYGDYVVKALVGPIDSRLDGLDEVRLPGNQYTADDECPCCTIL